MKTILFVFDHTMAPILLYGSETWGLQFAKFGNNNKNDMYFKKHLDNNDLTQLEIKFYKRLLQVKRNTATLAVRSELGRHPITLKAINRSIKYFSQIQQKPGHKLVKQALDESIKLDSMGNKTWYTQYVKIKQNINIPNIPITSTKYTLKHHLKMM